jgi:hypothetical protein
MHKTGTTYIITTTCGRAIFPPLHFRRLVCIHPWKGLLTHILLGIYTRALGKKDIQNYVRWKENIGNSTWIYEMLIW